MFLNPALKSLINPIKYKEEKQVVLFARAWSGSRGLADSCRRSPELAAFVMMNFRQAVKNIIHV